VLQNTEKMKSNKVTGLFPVKKSGNKAAKPASELPDDFLFESALRFASIGPGVQEIRLFLWALLCYIFFPFLAVGALFREQPMLRSKSRMMTMTEALTQILTFPTCSTYCSTLTKAAPTKTKEWMTTGLLSAELGLQPGLVMLPWARPTLTTSPLTHPWEIRHGTSGIATYQIQGRLCGQHGGLEMLLADFSTVRLQPTTNRLWNIHLPVFSNFSPMTSFAMSCSYTPETVLRLFTRLLQHCSYLRYSFSLRF
jgi:hypothetical protein